MALEGPLRRFDPVAAADSAGDVLLVTKFLPPGEAMTAHATQLGPTGQERWSAPLDVYADTRPSITATSGDDVRVGGGGKILAFGPDGTPAWMQWGTSVVDLAPMSDGRVVALLHRPGCSFERCGEGRIVEYDADGSVRWTVSTGSETDFRGVAVSPDGTVYATDEEANVEKISPDGAVLWVHPWSATFAPGSRPAAVLPDGSVAVASSERLQVYAPDVGPLRWEIPLAPGASFAVGPSGELFLAQTYPTEPNCFGLELAELGPDGAERARRKLGTFRCTPDAGNDGPPHLSATVSRSGDPIVAGTVNVPVDFGDGTLTPAGTDVFVIVLAP